MHGSREGHPTTCTLGGRALGKMEVCRCQLVVKGAVSNLCYLQDSSCGMCTCRVTTMAGRLMAACQPSWKVFQYLYSIAINRGSRKLACVSYNSKERRRKRLHNGNANGIEVHHHDEEGVCMVSRKSCLGAQMEWGFQGPQEMRLWCLNRR